MNRAIALENFDFYGAVFENVDFPAFAWHGDINGDCPIPIIANLVVNAGFLEAIEQEE